MKATRDTPLPDRAAAHAAIQMLGLESAVVEPRAIGLTSAEATLSAADCLLGLALGLVPVTVLELVKLARFRGDIIKEDRHALRV